MQATTRLPKFANRFSLIAGKLLIFIPIVVGLNQIYLFWTSLDQSFQYLEI